MISVMMSSARPFQGIDWLVSSRSNGFCAQIEQRGLLFLIAIQEIISGTWYSRLTQACC